jgi:hypothetical protein
MDGIIIRITISICYLEKNSIVYLVIDLSHTLRQAGALSPGFLQFKSSFYLGTVNTTKKKATDSYF